MPNTKKLAVIGNPISHSLSPQIHQHFASQFNIDMSYEAIEAPIDGFKNTIKKLQQDSYLGVNVTVPFKLEAYDLATSKDVFSEVAKASNTLLFNNNQTVNAFNTDGLGLVKDITETHGISLQDKTLLILGAGGAVQGIIKPLLDAGLSSITISNRTHSKAHALAKKFSSYAQVYAIQQALLPYTPAFDILINGTSASISGTELNIPENLVTRKTCCYDLMYSKQDTPFVAWAKKQNVAYACDGIGMLIEQAALAFSIWHRQSPNTKSTKKHLETLSTG